MGQKIEAPKGHLRDLRFLLCSSVGLPVVRAAHPRLGGVPWVMMPRRYIDVESYRLLMAEHRMSSTGSKPRRASRAKGSRKPSAPRAPRSKSSKVKNAAS